MKSIVCQTAKMDSEIEMHFKPKQQEQNSCGLSDLDPVGEPTAMLSTLSFKKDNHFMGKKKKNIYI